MSSEVLPSFPGLVIEDREPYFATEVYSSPGSQEQRVSRMASKRWRWRGRGILRQEVAAPSPYQAQGELDCLLRFHERHKGAGESFLLNDPVDAWRSNLFPYSEPLLANLTTKTAGITQGTLTDGGLSNGAGFPALAQDDYAYELSTIVAATSYVVSVFVKMADLSVPVVGPNSISYDFGLVSDAAVHGTVATVTALGGNLYRVSGARTATVGGGRNGGVVRYATQSGKGFTVTGYQIEAAAARPTVYTPTSGAAFSPQKRVRFAEDELSTRRARHQWYEVDFELVSVLGET